MQNNVKYVFTHFVKYVTLDKSSAPTTGRRNHYISVLIFNLMINALYSFYFDKF